MATDATGTPTSLGIPKYNTAVDAPSGLGFNAAMDAIDALFLSRTNPGLPSSPSTSQIPVWNGSSWSAKGGLSVITHTLLVADTAQFTFSSIPSTFTHLRLELVLRTTQAVVSSGFIMRFNSDSGNNYDHAVIHLNNATVTGTTSVADNVFGYPEVPGASATTSKFGIAVLDIPLYTGTTAHKNLIGTTSSFASTAAADLMMNFFSGLWRSTSAINRIDVMPLSGNFKAGSAATLYGIGV